MVGFWKKKQFWGGLIGLGLLTFCVKDIRGSELRTLLSQVNPGFLAAGLVMSFFFLVLRGLRWKLLVGQQNSIMTLRAVTLYAAGQVLNSVMPVLTGQVGRLILFARKEGLRKTFVFSTMVLEILFDSLSLIIFVFFTSLVFPFPDQYRFIGYIVIVLTAVVILGLYVILHFQKGLEDYGRRRLRERWPGAHITVKKFIRSFIKGIELLRSSQHLAGSLVYSVAAWVAHLLAIYLLFEAFGLQIRFSGAAAVMIINTLVLMIPITPGNAGTFEVAVSTTMSALAVGRSDAVLFALALHIVDILPMFVLGFIFLHVEKLSLRQLRREHEHEVILRRISEEGTFIEEEVV